MVSNIVVTSNIQTEKGRHKVFGRHFWGELEYAHYNLGLIIGQANANGIGMDWKRMWVLQVILYLAQLESTVIV